MVIRTFTTLFALAFSRPPKPQDINHMRPLLPKQREVAKRLWLQYIDEAKGRAKPHLVAQQRIRVTK